MTILHPALSPRARVATALILVLAATELPAQATRSGGGASSQIMQQYQQLAAERTQLQAENAKLKTDLAAASTERDALKKERDALKAKASGGDASAARVAAANQAAEEKLAEQRRKTEELVARYRDTATSLQTVEKDRTRLQAELTSSGTALGQCAERNVALGGMINEVLTRYEQQGFLHKATIDEPFTRITRNRVESLTTEYRLKAAELAQPAAKP